jgi:capsular exopolysaccharide synthesis family protein
MEQCFGPSGDTTRAANFTAGCAPMLGDELMMQGPLSRYILLARRWAWVVLLGIVICGGSSYVISKLARPVYQGSAIFVINVDSTSDANATASIAAVPTYAQLLTNPTILNPVVAKHGGMTLQQLNAMITIKPQTNTQLIELDVQSGDPRFAAQLANEVGKSFLLYSNSQLPGSVQMLPATVPTTPVKPKPLQNGGIGALIGLGLAITLALVFEWVEDRLSGPEEAQELLAMDVLATIPSDKKRKSGSGNSLAQVERYRRLAARLNAAQSVTPFKLVLVTSALAGEGKSTIAANLATFLATASKRVLLIDANLRHPTLHRHFQLDNRRGLSNVFREMWTSPRSELYGQETDIPSLRVLTSGTLPTRPAELLQSPLAHTLFEHLKEAPFDFVIFDAPPLLPVADAEIMSFLVHSVVLVIDASKTPRRTLARAKRVLANTRARALGIALNKSPWPDDGADRGYPDTAQGREGTFPLTSRSAPQSAMVTSPRTPSASNNGGMPPTRAPAGMARPPHTPPLEGDVDDPPSPRPPVQGRARHPGGGGATLRKQRFQQ